MGDGGFTMLMGEFVTAVKYNLPIKVVIIKNNTLGQIKWEQMVFLGNPEYGVELQPDRLRQVRRGVRRRRGSAASDPSEVRPALREALAVAGSRRWSRRWSIPSSRPCRAKATLEQALHFAESLVRGEPEPGQDRADRLPTTR